MTIAVGVALAGPHNQLDPPHPRDSVIGAVSGLASKRMLIIMLKWTAHGTASHNSIRPETWSPLTLLFGGKRRTPPNAS